MHPSRDCSHPVPALWPQVVRISDRQRQCHRSATEGSFRLSGSLAGDLWKLLLCEGKIVHCGQLQPSRRRRAFVERVNAFEGRFMNILQRALSCAERGP